MISHLVCHRPPRRRRLGPLLLLPWVLGATLAARAQQPLAADGSPLDPYHAASTPVLKVALGTGGAGGINARLAQLNALATGAPVPSPTAPAAVQALGGVFSEVSLGYLNGSGSAPAPATVSLQFSAANTGTTAWVQPMDGGAILGRDANGNPVSLPGGTPVTLDATRAASFRFQAPARTGRFQVIIRLRGVSSTLPFRGARPGGGQPDLPSLPTPAPHAIVWSTPEPVARLAGEFIAARR